MINEKIIDDFLDEYSALCDKHKMFIGALCADAFCKLRVCLDNEQEIFDILWDSENQKFARNKNEQR